MNLLTFYLVIFTIEILFESFLEILNLVKASSSSDTPDFFKNHISDAIFRKSVRYTVSKGKFSLFSMFINSAVLLLFIFTGLFGKIEYLLENSGLNQWISGILFIYITFFLFTVLLLPLKIYSEFVIEKKFGFSKMTVKLFLADMFKGTLISLIITFPLLSALFWFMDRAGSLWWLYAFLFTAVFEIALHILYPVLIAPLFNKFEKLDDGPLYSRLKNLAGRLDFSIKGIFRMDGSRRSGHSNAYFTGFGRLRRIVLFDTLLNTLDEKEIEAVLAHEIGHYKKHHMIKGIILSLFMLLAGFYIINLLLGYVPVFTAFGFNSSSYYGIIVILILYSSPFTFFLTPLFNLLSRKHEYEADRFAVKAVENRESLKNALLKLGSENLSNLVPHRLYSFYHYSHPALYERLKAMDRI